MTDKPKPPPRRPPPMRRPRRRPTRVDRIPDSNPDYIECPLESIYQKEDQGTETYHKPCGKPYADGDQVICEKYFATTCTHYKDHQLQVYIKTMRDEFAEFNETNPDWDKDLEDVLEEDKDEEGEGEDSE